MPHVRCTCHHSECPNWFARAERKQSNILNSEMTGTSTHAVVVSAGRSIAQGGHASLALARQPEYRNTPMSRMHRVFPI
jgi:hypothetical protein